MSGVLFMLEILFGYLLSSSVISTWFYLSEAAVVFKHREYVTVCCDVIKVGQHCDVIKSSSMTGRDL